MQEKIEKGEVDIVEEEEVVVEEVVDITTYKKVPSIQDYLKEHFYLLAVLGEEDEYRTTKWRKFHLGSHNLIQTVYAHVHSDISLADVILGIFV
jgi:hypothetical protein